MKVTPLILDLLKSALSAKLGRFTPEWTSVELLCEAVAELTQEQYTVALSPQIVLLEEKLTEAQRVLETQQRQAAADVKELRAQLTRAENELREQRNLYVSQQVSTRKERCDAIGELLQERYPAAALASFPVWLRQDFQTNCRHHLQLPVTIVREMLALILQGENIEAIKKLRDCTRPLPLALIDSKITVEAVALDPREWTAICEAHKLKPEVTPA